MSQEWKCPRCGAVNQKPDYVLHLVRLRDSLGVIGLGRNTEIAPHCSGCNLEADVNAILKGEYDTLEKKTTETPLELAEKPSVKPNRLALIYIGGVLIVFICMAIGAHVGAGLHDNQIKERGVASPSAASKPAVASPATILTNTPRPTATAKPTVRMLYSLEAKRVFETQTIPFLARRAAEQYTEEELNRMDETLVYTIRLTKSEPLAWGMGWCASTKEILLQNFEHIRYTFILNGGMIPTNHFVLLEYYAENSGGYCRQYYTVLTDWLNGETMIQTIVSFDAPINDGWDDYPAGTKTYEYRVTVGP